jgi:hypothetical protein
MLIDVSVPEPTESDNLHSKKGGVPRSNDSTTVALKTEAQQEEEKRALEKKQAIERRDARRKSLGRSNEPDVALGS